MPLEEFADRGLVGGDCALLHRRSALADPGNHRKLHAPAVAPVIHLDLTEKRVHHLGVVEVRDEFFETPRSFRHARQLASLVPENAEVSIGVVGEDFGVRLGTGRLEKRHIGNSLPLGARRCGHLGRSRQGTNRAHT